MVLGKFEIHFVDVSEKEQYACFFCSIDRLAKIPTDRSEDGLKYDEST